MLQNFLSYPFATFLKSYLLFCVGCAFLFLLACSEEQKAPVATVPSVIVTQVRQDTIPIYDEYVGQTAAYQTVEVRARVEGIILEERVDEGKEVKKDAVLYIIDPETYKIALENAQSKLQRDQAILQKAKNDVTRLRPLVQQKAVSRQKLDDAVAKFKESAAIWKTGQTAVKEAKLNLAYTTVRAPISGLIGRQEVSVGSLVGKGEPTLLAVISRLDPFYVNFTMSEQDAFKVGNLHDKKKLGKASDGTVPIHMVLQDESVYPHVGEIDFVDRQFDSKTGTLAFRAKFPNPQNRMRPGMYAKVRMLLTEKVGALLIPQRAIQEGQGGQFVFVVQEDNTVQRRPVTAGYRHGDEWIIEEGVKLGERVIVEGHQKVRPRMTVKPVSANQAIDQT